MQTNAFTSDRPEVGPRGRCHFRGEATSSEATRTDVGQAPMTGEDRSAAEADAAVRAVKAGPNGAANVAERRGRGGGRHGFGRPGGWQNADLPAADDAQSLVRGTATGGLVLRRST